jgi:hypothetical protein
MRWLARTCVLLAILTSGCSASDHDAADAATDRISLLADPDPFPLLQLTAEHAFCDEDDRCDLRYIAVVVRTAFGYVIAGNGSDLLHIDSAGRFVATIGRGGAGPGEYRNVIAGAATNGGVAVVDFGNMRLSFHDSVGTFSSSRPIPMPPRVLLGVRVRDSTLYALIGTAGDTPVDAPARLVRLDHDGDEYVTVATVQGIAVRTNGEFTAIAPLFLAQPQWDVLDGAEFAYTRGDRYDVEIRNPLGDTILTFTIDLPPASVASSDVNDELERRLSGASHPPGYEESVRSAAERAAASFPALDRLEAVRDQLIWVRRYAKPGSDSARWDAFSTAGKPIGHVRLAAKAIIHDGGADWLLVTSPDSLDVPRVTLYGMSLRNTR